MANEPKRKTGSILLKLLLVAAVILLSSCSLFFYSLYKTAHDAPTYFTPRINGRVLDENTRRPIQNAYLKIFWFGGDATVDHEYYYTVFYSKTDRNGRFFIESRKHILKNTWIFGRERIGIFSVLVAPPGYQNKFYSSRVGEESHPGARNNFFIIKSIIPSNHVSQTILEIRTHRLETDEDLLKNAVQVEKRLRYSTEASPQNKNIYIENGKILFQMFPDGPVSDHLKQELQKSRAFAMDAALLCGKIETAFPSRKEGVGAKKWHEIIWELNSDVRL